MTERDREIMRMLGEGSTLKEVGERFFISPARVRQIRMNIEKQAEVVEHYDEFMKAVCESVATKQNVRMVSEVYNRYACDADLLARVGGENVRGPGIGRATVHYIGLVLEYLGKVEDGIEWSRSYAK